MCLSFSPYSTRLNFSVRSNSVLLRQFCAAHLQKNLARPSTVTARHLPVYDREEYVPARQRWVTLVPPIRLRLTLSASGLPVTPQTSAHEHVEQGPALCASGRWPGAGQWRNTFRCQSLVSDDGANRSASVLVHSRAWLGTAHVTFTSPCFHPLERLCNPCVREQLVGCMLACMKCSPDCADHTTAIGTLP